MRMPHFHGRRMRAGWEDTLPYGMTTELVLEGLDLATASQA